MQEFNYLTMLTAVREEEEQKATHRAIRNANSSFIEFKNGSYIKVLSASQNARGHAFHKVLHEPGIDYEVLNELCSSIHRETQILE